ncbi:MAG: hypothetical protein GXZ09_10930 [Syntrophomonadaceae bacterium]|jgi:hypothetical protein|nr:hypothetical protein [Syntrophomonadaceae bacterium]
MALSSTQAGLFAAYTFFALHTLCGNNSGKPFTETDHEHETGNKIIVLSGKQLIKV